MPARGLPAKRSYAGEERANGRRLSLRRSEDVARCSEWRTQRARLAMLSSVPDPDGTFGNAAMLFFLPGPEGTFGKSMISARPSVCVERQCYFRWVPDSEGTFGMEATGSHSISRAVLEPEGACLPNKIRGLPLRPNLFRPLDHRRIVVGGED